MLGWDLDEILAGPRLRTRRRYAAALVGVLVEAGFELIATFGAPHYSVVLPAYTEPIAERLVDALGEARHNPHHDRREQR